MASIATLQPINIRSYWPDNPTINQMIEGGIRLWDLSYPENNENRYLQLFYILTMAGPSNYNKFNGLLNGWIQA